MSIDIGFPLVSENIDDDKLHRQKLAQAINRTIGGKLNIVGEITLNDGSTSTDLVDKRITVFSVIRLMPLTANAAAVQGSIWFDATTQQNEFVTIKHSNSANTDMTFRYVIIG